MFWRILKKDLIRKKGVNLILFIFMILATVFVASSVNNILVVSNATNYCMDKGNVPDKYISTFEENGQKHLDQWLDHNSLVKDYSKNEAIIISANNIDSYNGKPGKDYILADTIMLQSQWNKHMLIFDKKGNLLHMKDGQIGMLEKEMIKNHLKLGDTMTLKFGNLYKKFTIATVIMDPAFGGDFVGMTRYLISDSDYKDIAATGAKINYSYCVDTNNLEAFTKDMNKQGFGITVSVDRNMFGFAYVMSMITAGILIIIGLCLILISFLILRFTIMFTLQEDYKEIGIMKAIGIKNFTIKKIYMVKYFVLVGMAAVIGCILSIPVSDAMIKSVSENILMESGSANVGINILCSFGVMIIVLLLCYISTNRLRKFSAVEAIRSGQTGERFRKKSTFSLYKHNKISTPFFLAVNDVFSNIKRYIVLILTFTIGTILIILPLNTITSLGSKEMAKNLAIETNSDFYINPNNQGADITSLLDKQKTVKQIESIKNTMKNGGYDVTITSLLFYSFTYYKDDPQDTYQFMTAQPLGCDGSYIELIEGKTPVLENEIAMSEKVMDKIGAKIGDTLHMKVNGKMKDMIVTGKYQNYINLGQSVLLNSAFPTDNIPVSEVWYYQGKVNNVHDKKNIIDNLRKEFPQYMLYDINQTIESQLGSTSSQLNSLKLTIIMLICGVNILITILMMKIFIIDEKGQIAMLRSIGFSLRTVRIWQMLRISIVLLIAILLGIVSSTFLNDIALRPIFGMMGGTHMKIQVNPLEAYLLYPMLLFVVTNAAAFISCASIKKFKLMEINNIE